MTTALTTATETAKMETFGVRIKRLRKLHQLTLEGFAKRVGYNKSYLSRLERDRSNHPSLEFLEAICREFQVTREWLEQGTWPPSKLTTMKLDHASLVRLQVERIGEACLVLKNILGLL